MKQSTELPFAYKHDVGRDILHVVEQLKCHLFFFGLYNVSVAKKYFNAHNEISHKTMHMCDYTIRYTTNRKTGNDTKIKESVHFLSIIGFYRPQEKKKVIKIKIKIKKGLHGSYPVLGRVQGHGGRTSLNA